MSLDALRGRVAFVFEEADFDVDQIVGVENIRLTDPDALAACAMRRFDPGFAGQVEPGDVVVGAENFGYGHPHFAPMIGLRRLGAGCWRGRCRASRAASQRLRRRAA